MNFSGDISEDVCVISFLPVVELEHPVGFDSRHAFECECIVQLNPRFNVQVCEKAGCLNDEHVIDKITILHFAGDSKPWNMQNCVRQKIVQACQQWKHYS